MGDAQVRGDSAWTHTPGSTDLDPKGSTLSGRDRPKEHLLAVYAPALPVICCVSIGEHVVS